MATSPEKRKTQQPQQHRTWIKNHQLEGDGLVTGFYNFLHKRNAKTMKACKDVLIPDTIVFDHNFPRGWYTSDFKARDKEITKKQGKELDASSIESHFCKTPNPSVAIVASYMSSYEDDAGETVTQVEFFNETTLSEFVGRKIKKEGILQKFIIPKGLRNSVIQAVWSPRVCIVQRRTNRGSIKDTLQCQRDPYPVSVTYEGPTHFSEEGTCAPHTTEEVKDICKNIVEHFYVNEHKYITRMVLYFKVDEKDQIWLLWCGSLRVSDKEVPSQMPLNLAPKFCTPSDNAAADGGSAADWEDAELLEADRKYHHMTNDTLFYTTYIKPVEDSEANQQDHGGDNNGTSNENQQKNKAQQKHRKEDEENVDTSQQEDDENWHNQPGIQDQYRQLQMDRELVLSAMDDIFYEAYGHFLRHDPGPFNFEVDRKVATTLQVDVLQELMQAMKIDHALPSDDGATSVDDEELCFTIPPTQGGPVTKLGDQVAKWVNAHYDRRIEELKEEAASAPPPPPPNEEEEQETQQQQQQQQPQDEEEKAEEPPQEG